MTSAEANALHNPFLSAGRFRQELKIHCRAQEPDTNLLQGVSVALTFPNQDWIEAVAEVSTVTSLFIDRPRASDLTPISRMHLTHLSMSYPSHVKDWGFLRCLPALVRLSIHNASFLHSFEDIASLSQLQVLQLSGGYSRPLRLPSLHPLAECHHLVAVLLAAVRFVDWSLAPLFALSSLRRFDCPLWWPAEEVQALLVCNPTLDSNAIAKA